MKVFEQASDLIGNTPLVRLNGYQKEKKLDAELLAKLEYFNPAGSVKDRVALYMLLDAQEKGLLKRDSVIIEPTSGNTGIGLAAVAAEKGIRTIIVMPDTMSIERRNILKAYGAELVLTDGKLGMKGAIAKANELAEEIPIALFLDSSPMMPTLLHTIKQPARKSGRIPTGMWIFWLPVSEPVEHFPVQGVI